LKAKVKRVHIDEKKRIIVISDVHGNLNVLKHLLEQTNFSTNDVLFINGDLIEKGNQNLETLRYVINLSKSHTIYAICGNHDAIVYELHKEKENPNFLPYLLWRKNSIIHEMASALSYTITEKTDMNKLKNLLIKHFQEELDWIINLPDIIETQKFIFVHAALTSINLEEQNVNKVRRSDSFLEDGITFNKYCIVGHWPVVLYCKGIPSCNPIVDQVHKIISIDGGNVLKRDGQLNALIIPNMNSEDFKFDSYDELESVTILEKQEENENAMYIPWIDNKIKILEKDDEFSYCEHEATGYKMWILNKYIFEKQDGVYCEDSTDYRISVLPGDKVKLIEKTSRGYLIKRDGVTGWYYGSII
jgi:protein phosphatase